MNLETRLTNVLCNMHHTMPANTDHQRSVHNIISCIDLTILDKQATSKDIIKLTAKANQHQVAAICIYPEHLKFIPTINLVKIAIVINFPDGIQPQKNVLIAIKNAAAQYPINEIDYVFPYKLYLADQKQTALALCHEIYQYCAHEKITFKVIIETGALPSNQIIYELSSEIIKSGCHFLKTSTGKITQGATIPAVFAILCAITDNQANCGIKISGGIKTFEEAIDYINLSQYMFNKPLNKQCFRLGASRLLDNLLSITSKNLSSKNLSIPISRNP